MGSDADDELASRPSSFDPPSSSADSVLSSTASDDWHDTEEAAALLQDLENSMTNINNTTRLPLAYDCSWRRADKLATYLLSNMYLPSALVDQVETIICPTGSTAPNSAKDMQAALDILSHTAKVNAQQVSLLGYSRPSTVERTCDALFSRCSAELKEVLNRCHTGGEPKSTEKHQDDANIAAVVGLIQHIEWFDVSDPVSLTQLDEALVPGRASGDVSRVAKMARCRILADTMYVREEHEASEGDSASEAGSKGSVRSDPYSEAVPARRKGRWDLRRAYIRRRMAEMTRLGSAAEGGEEDRESCMLPIA